MEKDTGFEGHLQELKLEAMDQRKGYAMKDQTTASSAIHSPIPGAHKKSRQEKRRETPSSTTRL
jgi:hypothetical protein